MSDGYTVRVSHLRTLSTARGRFSLDFLPRSDVAYRVALVGQFGLGGSAAAIPVATR